MIAPDYSLVGTIAEFNAAFDAILEARHEQTRRDCIVKTIEMVKGKN